MNLERSSWAFAIAGTIFSVSWGIWTYMNPPESTQPTTQSQTSTKTGQNILINGNNNVISSKVDTTKEPKNKPELAISSLTTGVSREYIEAKFGTPIFNKEYPELGVRNLIFAFPRFFLQAIISNKNELVFYSVTTRSSDFRPSIPKIGGALLDSKFSDFENSEHMYSYLGSKYYSYAEKTYLGNSGNYRNYYIGYCPSGFTPDWGYSKPAVLSTDGQDAINELRRTSSPNCYGVGDILGDEKEIIDNIGIGVDYFISRDL